MGRPPFSDKAKTDTPLRIRLTIEERAALDKAAAKARKSTSTWARDTLLKIAQK